MGAVTISVGLAVWVWRPDLASAANAIKTPWGFELTMNTPALMVMGVGALILFGGAMMSPQSKQTIPFKCSITPGYTCYYAFYTPEGKFKSRISLRSGEPRDFSLSSEDLYCVGTEPPPDDPNNCKATSAPGKLTFAARTVGHGDGYQ